MSRMLDTITPLLHLPEKKLLFPEPFLPTSMCNVSQSHKEEAIKCCRCRTNDIVFGTERCKSELILVGFEPLNRNLEWIKGMSAYKNAVECRWRGVHDAVPV